MRAFSVYICDRSKVCLYHRDWSGTPKDEAAQHNDFITLYGLFFQMKLFATAADPTKAVGSQEGCKPDGMRPTPIGEGTGFRYALPHKMKLGNESACCLDWTWPCSRGMQPLAHTELAAHHAQSLAVLYACASAHSVSCNAHGLPWSRKTSQHQHAA